MPLSSEVRWTGSSLANHASGDTYIQIDRDHTANAKKSKKYKHIDNEVVIIGLLELLLLLFVVAAVFMALMMVAFFILTR